MKTNRTGKFRFTYFSNKYEETFDFYKDKLGYELGLSWDRNENDKGALFNVGEGIIEILHRPGHHVEMNPGLDYRIPQGVWMGIQVWKIDELYEKCSSA